MSAEPEMPRSEEGDDFMEQLRGLSLRRPSDDLDRRVLDQLRRADGDDGLRKVEMLLASMQLREPSVELDRRVKRLRARSWSAHWRLAVAASVLAAASTFMVLRWLKPPVAQDVARTPAEAIVPAPAPERSQHAPETALPLLAHGGLRIQRDIMTVSDQGLFERESSAPVRVFRAKAMKRVLYVDPTDQSRIRITVPVEKVVVQPVNAF